MILIIVLGIFIAWTPKQTGILPFHLDEWFHMACAKQILTQGTAFNMTDPFYGGQPWLFQFAERGFHLLLGVLQIISGLDWLFIFRYIPSVIFVMIILATYIMGKRQGFGLESAFFVSLLPTTVGSLGPAFLVPVATGLLFISLSLFIIHTIDNWKGSVVLAIFVFFLLSFHAYTAIAVVVICFPYLLFKTKENWKSSVRFGLAFLLPFLISYPLVSQFVDPILAGIFDPHEISVYIDFPWLIDSLGYISLGMCLVGIFFIGIRPNRQNLGLLSGFLVLLTLLVIYYQFHYGITGLYERGLLYALLVANIIAGVGLAALRKMELNTPSFNRIPHRIVRRGQITLAGTLIILVVITVVPQRQSTQFYKMIDESDYQVFCWIRDNYEGQDIKALVDPWKGTAFTAVSGLKVTSRIIMAPAEIDYEIYEFLDNECHDSTFLVDNDISLVYTRQSCTSPDLMKVHDNVYVVRED
ncbi:MAG: hypothetical protein JW762_05625 [Dehalococcoidales bacterium]|nr:hypothetical protein [Dehalococcoidales bacterium]